MMILIEYETVNSVKVTKSVMMSEDVLPAVQMNDDLAASGSPRRWACFRVAANNSELVKKILNNPEGLVITKMSSTVDPPIVETITSPSTNNAYARKIATANVVDEDPQALVRAGTSSLFANL